MKNPSRSFLLRGAFAGLLGLVLAPVMLPAQSLTYSLTDLGTLPGPEQFVTPTGLNNEGQASGTSGPSTRAVRFSDGLVQDLGTLRGGSVSYGNAINNLGEVAGSSQFTNGGSILHATLFRNGTALDLGFLPEIGNYSQALGINDFTVIVGFGSPSKDTSNSYPFIWDAANGIRRIGTLDDGFGKAYSINNSGQITGTSAFNLSSHAFISDDAVTLRDLGTIGGNTSTGTFINADGHVVGFSTIDDFNRQHAFLYDGVMHDLGSLGGNSLVSDFSYAYGVNLDDTVVGSTYLPYHGGALVQVAFVYLDGTMYDLNTLVDSSGADYHLTTGRGINDQGQIVVTAIQLSTNNLRAVLLTPTGATSDTVTITRAAYNSRRQQLTVQATDSDPTATLQAYVTSTDTLLGPLRKKGTAYVGKFTLSTKPASVTVKSSLGGSDTAVVTGR